MEERILYNFFFFSSLVPYLNIQNQDRILGWFALLFGYVLFGWVTCLDDCILYKYAN